MLHNDIHNMQQDLGQIRNGSRKTKIGSMSVTITNHLNSSS